MVIDDQVVASWYDGHGSMNRWEHKGRVALLKFGTGQWVNEYGFNYDGSYLMSGLVPGNYRVQARVPGYIDEYWQEKHNSNEANPVAVTPGSAINNINFTMEKAGSISGYVYEANGSTAIPGATVNVRDFNTRQYIKGVSTGPDGIYTLSGLGNGQYNVIAWAPGHVRKLYPNTLQPSTCSAYQCDRH